MAMTTTTTTFRTKPTFNFVILTLTLVILLSLFTSAMGSDPSINDGEDGDLEGLEELLAVDDEEEKQDGGQLKSSDEADILRKAQRIVLELSNERTKSVIDGNEFVLLLGYAPWCARSAELMPQFAEAATILKEMESPLLMAKLDAERYPKAASQLGIKGYPTLLLFLNGSSHMYTGGFMAQDIVIWANKKTGVPIVRLNSLPEAEKFMSKYTTFVIALFEKFEGSKYVEFTKAAVDDNEIQFAETSDTEVAKVLFPEIETKKDLFLGLVKSEPEKYVSFENTFEKEKILDFLEYNKFPLVTVMTQLNALRVHSSPIKLQVIVFADAEDFKNLLLSLQNVARKFKSKIMFIYVDIADENLAKPFLTLFGLEDSDKAVTAFDNKNNSKYLLELDPTPSNLEEFCSRLLLGTMSPHFKSQPIPDNKEAIVKTIVGRTFEDLVLNTPQNVLLEVHTPWCINCEATSKQVEKLAKHFKGLDNLIISRIDASSNEHPKLQVDEFPTILFYPSADKSKPIKLPSKSSLKELGAFIKKNVRVESGRLPTQDQTAKDEL